MNVQLTFEPVDSLSSDGLIFWRQQQAQQDLWKGLTGTPEWFRMMAAGSTKPAVVAVVRADDGRIVALAPLLFQSMALGQKTALVARVYGGDVVVGSSSLEGEPCVSRVVKPYDGLLLTRLWHAIVERAPAVQAIILDHVDESRLPLVRSSCAPGSGFFLHARSKLMPHYRLILPPTYDEFRKLRSASSLKKIEGRERAMTREVGGECRLVEIRGLADWTPYAADINRLMNTTFDFLQAGRRPQFSEFVVSRRQDQPIMRHKF